VLAPRTLPITTSARRECRAHTAQPLLHATGPAPVRHGSRRGRSPSARKRKIIPPPVDPAGTERLTKRLHSAGQLPRWHEFLASTTGGCNGFVWLGRRSADVLIRPRPAHPGQGERPARVRLLCPRPGHRELLHGRAHGPHPVRQPGLGDDALRPVCPAQIRAPAIPQQLKLTVYRLRHRGKHHDLAAPDPARRRSA